MTSSEVLDPDGRWHYRRSLASRVTLLTTMAVGLSVAIVALGAYVTVRMQLQSSLDDSLVERAQTAATDIDQINNDTDAPAFLLGASDVRIGFVQFDGEVRFLDTGDRIRLDEHEVAVAGGDARQSLRTVRAGGVDYRVVAVPIQGQPGLALVIAQSLEPQQRVLTKLGLVTLLFGIAGMITAGVAGWAVARNGLRPVRRLTIAAEDIARTERLAPIPVEGDDEIARLASAFNQMLASLAASRDRQRRLVADAGHELRTPLTSLRTNIDLLSQAGSSLPDDARAELLTDVRAQLEELTTLVGDLVELARDEPTPAVIGTVELHEVLDHAVARVRRRASTLSFSVDRRPVVRRGRRRRARTGAHQPPRQRRQVEPAVGHRAGRAAPGRHHRRRRGARHRRGRPAPRLRAVLPLLGVPRDARLGPRPLDRGPGRRAARRHGRRRPRADRRHPRHAAAARRLLAQACRAAGRRPPARPLVTDCSNHCPA